jgi:primosomal protein N'
MTITLECPWCDGPVALHDEDEAMTCEGCGIVATLAPEPLEVLAAAA